ncbi:MAG: glutamate--tRNA ligase [Lentisphaeria bacterium]|nr:glutamate--tRNA ligase [Lentisphaeria bacterium]
MSIRVRFAPSPTGNVHIGNIRAAIFNWLFARNQGGSFLLRVEDTDRERSTQDAIDKLREVMDWMGLDIDEDVLYQSQRADAHIAAAEQLLTENKAYRYAKGEGGEATLFRIPWNAPDFDFVREAGKQELILHPDSTSRFSFSGFEYSVVSKKGKAVPQEACLAGFHDLKLFDADGQCIFELNAKIDAILAGETIEIPSAVKAEFTRHEIFFEDLVKGEMAKPLDSMKDLVIVRSDGSPVFHLANICDDNYQEITHIIRGDDHVENSYRHIFLLNALAYTVPHYAHLPMIVNAQGKPFSKRDGDAYVGDFRAKGFTADALMNALALLGWSPGDDREKMSREELIAAFSLKRVKATPAQLDMSKLYYINGQYMDELDDDVFLAGAKQTLVGESWYEDSEKLQQVAVLMKSRCKVYPDVLGWGYFFSADFEIEEKLYNKNLAKEGVAEILNSVSAALADCDFLNAEAIENCLHQVAESADVKTGKVNLPLRLASTGTNAGADLNQTLQIIGKEEVTKRIQTLINKLS